MNSIERLTELFERFPGIGPRQARRFVQYLLANNGGMRAEIAELIKRLGTETKQCKRCFRWYVKDGYQGSTLKSPRVKVEPCCSICANPSRDAGLLFVVEKDAEIENVERSGFRGLYFVLGGVAPLAAEEPEKYIRARELLRRVEEDAAAGKVKEVILGLSATTEGDHTRLILQEKLLPIAQAFKLKLSSLGRGLSTGSELEYADPDTIASALSSRH